MVSFFIVIMLKKVLVYYENVRPFSKSELSFFCENLTFSEINSFKRESKIKKKLKKPVITRWVHVRSIENLW